MADYLIMNGGTRSSGASTADDWTLANAYPTWESVCNSATPGASIVDGDQIIFDSGPNAGSAVTHTHIRNRTLQLANTGTITVKSRFGVKEGCIHDATGFVDQAAWDLNNTTVVNNFIFEDMTFTRSLQGTGTNDPFFYVEMETGDITFTRCRIGSLDIAAGANSRELSAILYSRFNGATVTNRDFVFNDFTCDDITATSEDGIYGLRFDGDTGESGTVTFNGSTVFGELDFDVTADVAGSSNPGFLWFEQNITVNINGPMTVDVYASTQLFEEDHIGFFLCEGTLQGAGSIVGRNINISGGHTRCCLVHMRLGGTFNFNRIEAYDCTNTWGDVASGTSGAAFLSQSTGTSGTIDTIKAVRCTSRFGAAAYSSGGGAFIANHVEARDNVVRHGVIYCGGDGDAVVNNAVITGTTYNAAMALAGETQANSPGLDVYLHVHLTTAVRSKTTTIRQLTISDSDVTHPVSVEIRNNNVTHSHTVNMDNNAFAGGNPTAVHIDASGDMDLNWNNNAYPTAGDVDTTDKTGTGTFTNNNPIIVANLGVKADGKLNSSSILKKGGLMWWTTPIPTDILGKAFKSNPSIGAFQLSGGGGGRSVSKNFKPLQYNYNKEEEDDYPEPDSMPTKSEPKKKVGIKARELTR